MSFETVLPFVLSGLLGLLVGTALVFLGLGGGLIIVPLLPLIAGVHTKVAIATALVTVCLVAIQNAIASRDLIDWKSVFIIGTFSSLGSFTAGQVTARLDERSLLFIFGIMLVIMAVQTLRKAGKPAQVNFSARAKLFLVVAIGFGTGLLAGFTGIGGGIFIVPLLSMIGAVEQKKIVPTSGGTIVLTSAAGVLGIAFGGGLEQLKSNVRLDLALAVFAGGVIASKLARPHQQRLSPRNRDWLIGAILLALVIRTSFLILRP